MFDKPTMGKSNKYEDILTENKFYYKIRTKVLV